MSHGNRKHELRGAPEDHRIMVGRRVVYFTFGYMFGPLITDGYGQPAKWQPTSEKSTFWQPFEAWLQEYMEANPPPPVKTSTRSDGW